MASDNINKLITGFRKFKTDNYQKQSNYTNLVEKGQQPKIMVIACSDSRVDPALLFDASPGEFFVVRNVANLVPPYMVDPRHHGTSAALEFAVCYLKVTDIIILGHSNCGGIHALVTGATKDNSDFIHSWMNIASPAKLAAKSNENAVNLEEQAAICEQASLKISCQNLTTYPWIKEKLNSKEIGVHAWYFDMAAGEILSYMPDNDAFKAI